MSSCSSGRPCTPPAAAESTRAQNSTLAGFAANDRLRRFVAVDRPGGRLELPGRAAGEQCRKTELLDEHDRHRPAAAQS
jgi:hypothetical protein